MNKYVEEARDLIRQNFEEYRKYVLGAKSEMLCEVGMHREDNDKLYTCKLCGKKFCKFHGDVEKEICDSCRGAGLL